MEPRKEITIRIVDDLRRINKPIAEQTIFLTNLEDITKQVERFYKNNNLDFRKRTSKMIYIKEIKFLGKATARRVAEEIVRRIKWIR